LTADAQSATWTSNPNLERAQAAPFHSVLFPDSAAAKGLEGSTLPEFFGDLNLDQVVASITDGRDEYDLWPFFCFPLPSVDAIYYRQEIFRDLENDAVLGCVHSFAAAMRTMRSHLAKAEKLYYKRQKQRWFLEGIDTYCTAVTRLRDGLAAVPLHSRGLSAFRTFLADYTASPEFTVLAADTAKLTSELAAVQYSLHIHGNRITVGSYGGEPDYGTDVLETFAKFKQAAANEYRFEFRVTDDMNHVEAAILDLVAQRFSETFSFLEEYCARHSGYLDPTIAAFDREVQFYIACIEYARRFERAGLRLCYPTVSHSSKEVHASEAFELALAEKLIQAKKTVVTNDFFLNDPERILVVSGPNQGGKTTFARMFGQLHYLAALGCPAPAAEAALFLFDRLFTHFEREENLSNLTGKLEDELLRIRRILDAATGNSILIMNESFLSTTVDDALFLSKYIMERIIALDMLCVSVTFLDELTRLSKTTVSMVSTVNPNDPALRTFKIVRKPADGLAYALAIAEKHGLTYAHVKARIAAKSGERAAS
jgi:DNA mismatch repair protein MutS